MRGHFETTATVQTATTAEVATMRAALRHLDAHRTCEACGVRPATTAETRAGGRGDVRVRAVCAGCASPARAGRAACARGGTWTRDYLAALLADEARTAAREDAHAFQRTRAGREAAAVLRELDREAARGAGR